MRRLNLIRTLLIEGNIAVGKSTIISHIASTFPSSLVRVHREPIENWMNVKGFDLLKALYNESNRWTFAFEMTALLSRMTNHSNSINSHHITVYERSLLSCFHVFIRYDLEQKFINETEYKILHDHFDYCCQRTIDLSKTVILYFDLSPQECFRRIIKRSRSSETNIDLQRLEKLKYHYDRFMEHFELCPVITIDASQPLEKVCDQVDSLIARFIELNQANNDTSAMTNFEAQPQQTNK